MLMTGKHSGHSYIRGNYELGGFEDSLEGGQMPLPEGTFTIAHLMKNAGYTTGIVGKWGLGMNGTSGHPNKQGFDYFYGYLDQKQAHNHYPTHLWENSRWQTLRNPYIQVHKPLAPNDTSAAAYNRYKGNDYALDRLSEHALDFIKKNRSKPFFLYVPFTIPHVSLQAPDSIVKRYIGEFNDKPYRGEKGYASTLYPRATYAAMITYMDQQIGKIMQLLKELKLDNNTIVMFSSDNGTTFDVGGVEAGFFRSVWPLRGLKQDLYEGGIREPFIARWPGKIKPGRITPHISAQYDLLATLNELTRQKANVQDGISFLPTLLGNLQAQKQHPYLYFEFPEKSGQVAIRMGKWKGVKSNLKANRYTAKWEIYDLQEDLSEKNDIAAQHPELVSKFEEIMKKEHAPSHVREWEFVNPKFTKN
jgi:arylsulfatase A-like enzyme